MAKRKSRGGMSGLSRRQAVVDDPADPASEGTEDDTATKAWKAWRESRTHLSDWHQEVKEAYDFIAGRQYTEDEEASLKEQHRPVVVFNRVAVVLDAVSGYEINSRQDVTFQPREVDDTGAAQVESAGARYFREQCDAEDEESDAFYDLLAAGYGWVEHRMDFDDDPEGMLKVERVDIMEMGYDPSATKRNLSDRRWDIRGKWWDKEVAEAKFPDIEFDGSITGEAEDESGQKPVNREAAAFYKDPGVGEQNDRRRGKVFILEHTWFEHEPFTSYIDPTTDKMVDTTPAELKAVNEQLQAMAAQAGKTMKPLRSVKRTRKVFKRAFVHGQQTLNPDELEAPCPHRFHYQAMTGKRDRNKNVFFGLVRPMKDPQRWANKFFSQYMHILNANAKGGLMHEAGAFDNVKDVEKRLSKPGYRLEVNNGYFDKVRMIDPPPIPQDAMNMTQFSIGSTRDVTGVNVELLGMADRDQPGVLEHARKQSAMAILAPFFNAMRRYRKESGRLTLYFMSEYLSDGRLVRVVGKGAAKYVPLTKIPGSDKYDVVVDEAPTSPNAKEAVFAAISQLIPTLAKMGIPLPPSLLDYIPALPAQLAEEWKAQIEAGKSDPAKAKAAAMAEEKEKAEVEKTQSETLLNEAKATGEVGKIVGMLQQVLAGLGMLQQAIPGGSQPGQPPGVMPLPGGPAPPPAPGMPPPMMGPAMPMAPPMQPGLPPPNGVPPMVPNG